MGQVDRFLYRQQRWRLPASSHWVMMAQRGHLGWARVATEKGMGSLASFKEVEPCMGGVQVSRCQSHGSRMSLQRANNSVTQTSQSWGSLVLGSARFPLGLLSGWRHPCRSRVLLQTLQRGSRNQVQFPQIPTRGNALGIGLVKRSSSKAITGNICTWNHLLDYADMISENTPKLNLCRHQRGYMRARRFAFDSWLWNPLPQVAQWLWGSDSEVGGWDLCGGRQMVSAGHFQPLRRSRPPISLESLREGSMR